MFVSISPSFLIRPTVLDFTTTLVAAILLSVKLPLASKLAKSPLVAEFTLSALLPNNVITSTEVTSLASHAPAL